LQRRRKVSQHALVRSPDRHPSSPLCHHLARWPVPGESGSRLATRDGNACYPRVLPSLADAKLR
jgi:hypothetical protein